MKALWTAELPQSLCGSMMPVFDPLTESIYVADGWGTPFASLSLRQISVLDGSETAARRLRAPVFSVCFAAGSSVPVAAGKRLFMLDRMSLAEIERWESGIPNYSHFSAIVGRLAVLMSRAERR